MLLTTVHGSKHASSKHIPPHEQFHVALCTKKATNASEQLMALKPSTNAFDSSESSSEAIIAWVFGENSPSSWSSFFTFVAASSYIACMTTCTIKHNSNFMNKCCGVASILGTGLEGWAWLSRSLWPSKREPQDQSLAGPPLICLRQNAALGLSCSSQSTQAQHAITQHWACTCM